MELVGVGEAPAARLLLQQRRVVAVLAEPAPDRQLDRHWRVVRAALPRERDQVDIVLVAAEGPHRRSQRSRALKVDGECPQDRIGCACKPVADALIAAAGEVELCIG